uniref:Dynein heavy chain region D6 P-loop domain-containing protein n=1 Tax=Labrus bergylta TaxID=56723 RepID=A0A3Q3FFF1_9LABR
LNDMGRIDPMYQFSLDAYINLFNLSIKKSKRSQKLEERITNLNDYHTYAKMLIVRSLRQDRVSVCVTSFIVNNLGSRFVEPPVLDMKAVSVVEESTCRTPLIFVLSSGVDPTGALLQLADASGMSNHFHALSLGQGQAPIAKSMIEEGVKTGHWVFLANCHLSLSWMPELDKLVEHSSPHPEFPITILQADPHVLSFLVTEDQFNRCSRPVLYRKLLFSLCFFHSILLERKKFLQLGWNIVYGFNDSDFEVSENLLSLYLDEYEEIPWDALKYLIAGVNYGGHVTDDWDRRLLTTYINGYFCDSAVDQPFFNMLPSTEHPEVFGQHSNADIASQIAESRTLFDTLLSLQPQVTSPTAAGAGPSREDKAKLKQNNTQRREDNHSVLFLCISCVSSSLVELEKGITGLVVMSSSLEEIFHCIYDARVPPLWEKAYPSLKPLAAWTRDLSQRVTQFARWAETVQPPTLFWLSGFTFPNSFLTAVLQSSARQNNVSSHNPIHAEENSCIVTPQQEAVF